MPGTRYPNAEEHPPLPPLQRGNAEAKRWEKSEHKVRLYAAFRPVA